ncbi:MAG: RNA recognition motif domain-containing protein [Candidatus Moraniibacteriota bacterium]
MAKKLYVGNLPYALKDADLNQLFTQAGAVESAVIINDKATGRSKGFGFVEMTSDEDAQKAIEMFDAQELEGRKLTVNEARPMQPREDRGGFRGGNRF